VELIVNEGLRGRLASRNRIYSIQVLRLLCTCKGSSSLRGLGICRLIIKIGIVGHGELKGDSRHSQGRRRISRLI
jgi:hypothetical protein